MRRLVRSLRGFASDVADELAAERERREARAAYLASVDEARYRKDAA